METRANRLRRAIEVSGLQPAALAKTCGISRQYLNLILAGSRDGGKYWPTFSAALGVPIEWLTEGLAPPWWADPARANVVDVPYQPPPPMVQGPKTAEEQADDDRILAALYKAEERAANMEAKLDALLERMDQRPCMHPQEKPAPDQWAMPRKKVRADE